MNRYKYLDEKGQHLHILDGQPLYGTSSVSDVLAKPLTWWASGLAVKEFGCPDPKVLTKIKNKKATPDEVKDHYASLGVMHTLIQNMDIEEYAKLVDKAYRAHTMTLKEKAKEGTDLHAECERFIGDEMSGKSLAKPYYDAKIWPLIDWSRNNVAKHLWSEGNCYSEKHWIGGISDWGVELKDGRVAIVDFKSSKEAYLSQFWQCCGYAIQIEENGVLDRDGNQIYSLEGRTIDVVIVLPFGMENPYPQMNVDVQGGKEAFLAELLLYKKLPRD